MKDKIIITLLNIFVCIVIVFGLLISKYYLIDLKKYNKINSDLYKTAKQFIEDKEYNSAEYLAHYLLVKKPDDKEYIDLLSNINKLIKDEAERKRLEEELKYARMYGVIGNISKRLDILKKNMESINSSGFSENGGILYISNDENEPFKKGIIAFENKKYTEAKGLFSQALKMNPKDAVLNAFYGSAIFEENPEIEKNVIDAAEIILEVIKNDEKIEIAHLTLAKIYEKRGNTDACISEFLEAIKLNPNNYFTYYLLGKKYFDNNNLDNSEVNLISSIKLKEDFSKSYYYLAEIKKAKKDYNAAKEYYKKVIELDKTNLSIYVQLGDINFQEENFPEAISNYEKSLSKNENFETYYKIGNCNLKLGNIDDVLKNYKKSILLNKYKYKKEIDIALDIYKTILNIKRDGNDDILLINLLEIGNEKLKNKNLFISFELAKLYINKKKMQEAKKLLNSLDMSKLSDIQKEDVKKMMAEINKKK